MNHAKAALAAIIISAGSVVSCAAADMPLRDEPAAMERPPLRLQYSERYAERPAVPVVRERVACNAFGRCFRVGPPAPGFDGPESYPGPRVYAPPVYGMPDYDVRRSFREGRFADRDFGERGLQGERRFYGAPGYDVPRGGYGRVFEDRHSFGYGRRDEAGPHGRWSRDDRRFDEGSVERN